MGQSWYQLDWIWTATGWMLAAIGVALFVWALVWDRSRGRRRCPKCWYDMSGTPGRAVDGREIHVCPECGKNIRSVRGLHRTRRRWRGVLAALAILTVAYLAQRVPAYQRAGWVRLLPATYLAALAETTHWAPLPVILTPKRVSASGGPIPASELIGEEAWRRLEAHEMWDWQARWFLGRVIADDPVKFATRFRFPSRWVAGKRLPVYCDFAAKAGPSFVATVCGRRAVTGGEIDLFETPPEPGADIPVRLCVEGTRALIEMPIAKKTCHLEPSIERLFVLDPSPALGATAVSLLEPRLVVDAAGRLRLEMNERRDTAEWRSMRAGLGCEVDIMLGGVLAGRAAYWPNWKKELENGRSTVAVEWLDGKQHAARLAPEMVRLTIRGSPAMSFRSLSEWPFDDEPPTCWTGTIDCVPKVVREQD
jgi:hypothetical protein